MKYAIVVPDGAADHPLTRLNGRTPLEVARTPNMDKAAQRGLLGVTNHVPPTMTPGSSVAMMSLMGYDPLEYFTGRGPLEAADLGIDLSASDWAFRCNLVTIAEDTLADFTAGHISTEEAGALIETLNQQMGNAELSFHVGNSYRHIMVYRGSAHFDVETVPPHDIVGASVLDNWPRGEGAQMLVDLMRASRELLQDHEVNEVRVDLSKNPANMIWLWSPGQRPMLDDFEFRYGVRGSVISAVNLVRGLGRLVGWDVVEVPGITGYTDTDYSAKGRYAVDALGRYDLVLVHVEATDEASHDRDVQAKVRALEQIDREVVGPLMACGEAEGDMRLLICPDHVTGVEDGVHERGEVPFAMWGQGVRAASGRNFSEANASAVEVTVANGPQLMAEFIGTHRRRQQ